MRRVAVLMPLDTPEQRTHHAAFLQSLKQLGWVDGQNVRIESRWAKGETSTIRKNATDVVAFAPDVIVAVGNATMVALSQATRTVPIVFSQVADPVGSGFVKTMARPGQRYWFCSVRLQFEWEMARTSQADRAKCDAGGSSSRRQHTSRDRTIRHHPSRGTVTLIGSQCD
jgi:ABC transporter substrate binding protein